MFKQASKAIRTSAAAAGLVLLGGLATVPALDVPAASAADDDKNRFGHPDYCAFDGEWYSYEIGTLHLDESGRHVNGSYPDGRMHGRIYDDEVKGNWEQHDGDRGQLRLFLDQCDSMTAKWRYGKSGPWHQEYFTRQ